MDTTDECEGVALCKAVIVCIDLLRLISSDISNFCSDGPIFW